MPRVNRNKTSMEDLNRDNVMGKARNMLWQRGMNYAEVRAELHRMYPDASSRTLDAVIGMVKKSRENAGRYNRAGESYQMDRINMAVNTKLPVAYRWVVNITLTNPRTHEQSHRIVMVDSQRNLTKEEIQEQASGPAREAYSRGSGKDRYDMPFQPSDSIVTMQVITVECRTC